MTPYDPKRPRPRRSTETIAPVDALLDGPASPEATDPVDPDPSVETAADPAANAADSVVDVTDRTVGATPRLSAVPDSAEPGEPGDLIDESVARPGGPQTASRSETPTAPAPEEGTANRAVLVAGVTVLVAAIVAAIVVWLRRRD